MDITVANRDSGFLEPGIKIRYKFDAFPYYDYGTRNGIVASMSPAAVSAPSFTYAARGTLDQDFYEIRGKKYPIRPGMTAIAEMITEQKSIFSYLFERL